VCKSKTLSWKSAIIGVLVGWAGVIPVSGACPSTATDVGSAQSISTRAKGSGLNVQSGVLPAGVAPCQVIVVGSTVYYTGTNTYAWHGTTATVTPFTISGTQETAVNVAPANFTTVVLSDPKDPTCPGVLSEGLVAFDYTPTAADIAAGGVTFLLQYAGVGESGANNPVTGTARITVKIHGCDDNDPCTTDTCVPDFTGLATCVHTPLCTDPCSPCVNGICTPKCTDPCFPCINGSCSTTSICHCPCDPHEIKYNFNGTQIIFQNTPGGSYVWFISNGKVSGLPANQKVLLHISDQTIIIPATASSPQYTFPVPDAFITFDPSASVATTTFDTVNNVWRMNFPSSGMAGNVFYGGIAFKVPLIGLPGGIKNVDWSGTFTTDTAGLSVAWQWHAANYSNFTSDYNSIAPKPTDDNSASIYQNSDHAGTPEGIDPVSGKPWKSFVVGGATGGGGSNYTGSGSSTIQFTPCVCPNP
jgi:hypothetical protein